MSRSLAPRLPLLLASLAVAGAAVPTAAQAQWRPHTIGDPPAIAGPVAAHDPDAARAALHRHLARVAREFQRGVERDVPVVAAPGVRRTAKARRSHDSTDVVRSRDGARKSTLNPRRS